MDFESSKIGFLFDLDGVLVDSEGTYTGFWEDIDRRYPTGIDNFAVAIKGTTLEEIMKNYSDEAVRADIVRRLKEFQNNMQFPLYSWTLPFLAAMRDAGIRGAIVTSSDSSKMECLYAQHPGFKELFEVVIDGSQVEKSKPNPEGYLKAAGALGCAPERCFVFEDSMQGLKAGRASGATVVGLATTYPAERIEPLADVVVSGLHELEVAQLISRL